MYRSLRGLLCILFMATTWLAFAGDVHCGSCEHPTFLENKGQWHENVRYKADISGGHVFVEDGGLTFTVYDADAYEEAIHQYHEHTTDTLFQPPVIQCHAYKLRFAGANAHARITPYYPSEEYFNFFLGNDADKWASKVHGYEQIVFTNLYDNIDLVLYFDHHYFKYDLVLHPGADPADIKMRYEGPDGMSIGQEGALTIATSVVNVIEETPYTFYASDYNRQVESRFVLENNTVSFQLDEDYDPSQVIIIDPRVIFSTYSGSRANNFGYTATFDSKGNLYAGGSAFGTPAADYPTTTGAFSEVYGGGITDMGITKYAADGSTRIYSTYLGGSNTELPHSFIVNGDDELFVFGTSGSDDFPVTTGAYDTSYNGGDSVNYSNGLGVIYNRGSDIVVARFSADGTSLLASTYIGGSNNDGLNSSRGLGYNYADQVRGEIFVDDQNNCYIASCTYSLDFPVSTGAFQDMHGGLLDAVICKLDNDLTTLIWASFAGRERSDAFYSIVLDDDDNIYVAGGTADTTSRGGGILSDRPIGGRIDGWIWHIDKDGQNVLHRAFLGTTEYDQIYFVELDRDGNVYVLGQTEEPDSAFIYNAMYSQANSGQFITKIKPELDTVLWSVNFGRADGSPDISPTAFLVDVCNKVYVSGWGGTLNSTLGSSARSGTRGLDTTRFAYQTTTDNNDFYLMVLEDDASRLVYATYFGGNSSQDHVDGGTSRFDRNGIVYQSVCASCGGTDDFPIEPDTSAVVSAINGAIEGSLCNNAVFKFDLDLPFTFADYDIPPVLCLGDTLHFLNTSKIVDSNQVSFFWDFGDGDTSTLWHPSHVYDSGGFYTIRMSITDLGSCNYSDTVEKQILIISNTRDTLPDAAVCAGVPVQIGFTSSSDSTITYTWQPPDGLSRADVPNPIASSDTTITYMLFVTSDVGCTDTFIQRVFINEDSLFVIADSIGCEGDTLTIIIGRTDTTGIQTVIWPTGLEIVSDPNNDTVLAVLQRPGPFTITLTNRLGCTYQTTFNIAVYENPIELTADRGNICIGDSVRLRATSTSPTDTFTYTWRPLTHIVSGSMTDTPLVNPDRTTFFHLEVTSRSGCVFTDSIPIIVLRNMRDTLPTVLVCEPGAAQVGFSVFDTSLNYSWSPPDGLSQTNIPNPTTSVGSDIEYTVIVSNGMCADTFTQRVLVLPNQVSIDPANIICPGDTIDLHATVLDPSQSLTYEWTPATAIVSGAGTPDPRFILASRTKVYLTVTNSIGCVYRDSMIISVHDTVPWVIASADPDSIYPGETSQLTALSSAVESYSWVPESSLSDPSIPNPIASPTVTTIYEVLVVDSNGCVNTDTTIVYLKTQLCGNTYVFIPNAFTPNGDGNNDVLYVRGRNIEELYFAVYDRWGELMFESTDVNIGWDGTYKDSELDPAVFGYFVEGVCDNGEPFFIKGNVSLLR